MGKAAPKSKDNESEFALEINGTEEALNLFGRGDRNLRAVEKATGVRCVLRGRRLAVTGPADKVAPVGELLTRLLRQARENGPVPASDVSFALMMLADGVAQAGAEDTGDIAFIDNRGRSVKPRTPAQAQYLRAMGKHDLVFCIGPAGTGKTFLAVACALRALETRQVQRVILSRPVVEAGERLGFLPGDFLEKVNPYLRPLYDAFYSMIGPERFRAWRDADVIEIVPLAYMRGRTFDDAFIILDEAQNTTLGQIKLALTRLGEGSRMVVTGDITQTDLAEGTASGLVRVMEILKGVEGVAFHHLTEADVIRHPLVRKVIKAFSRWEKNA